MASIPRPGRFRALQGFESRAGWDRDDAVDVNRIGNVLKFLWPQVLQFVSSADALHGFGSESDLAGFGKVGEARREIGNRAVGGKDPAAAAAPFETGGADKLYQEIENVLLREAQEALHPVAISGT